MIDFLETAKFMQWLETAQIHPDVGVELQDADEGLKGPGLIFDDKTYIRIIVEDGMAEFATIAGRDEFQSVTLMEVIRWIWNNHAKDNAG